MQSSSILDFDDQPPPPRVLYKYLVSERAKDVLGECCVRFTALVNTNDTFEVRATFSNLAGPLFQAEISEQMDAVVSDASLEKMISEMLKERGLDFLSAKSVLSLLDQQAGGSGRALLRNLMQQSVDNDLVPLLNARGNAERMIEKMGNELLCFSLAERMDSAPMWAHYAENNVGFVVAFKTDHSWFHQRSDGSKTKLQKVAYFDGRLGEPLEDLRPALISKLTDWSYEQEWRLYSKLDQIDVTVGEPSDPVHPIRFPRELVDRVILGPNTNPTVTTEIRETINKSFPGVPLVRAVPDKSSGTYREFAE